jgi:glutathione S-transferase
MAKHIVFCADGTWNGATDDDDPRTNDSNVLKLFNALQGSLSVGAPADPEQERRALDPGGVLRQVAKYIHGVGNSSNILVRQLGGAIGTGLIARVLRGYTFVSRNFAPGDRIVLIGFSRGAYTARALGGLIANKGLLDWSALHLNPQAPDDEGYKYAAAAWYAYQQDRRRHNAGSSNWLGRLEGMVSDIQALAGWRARTPQYVQNLRIAAIGVWDTVGSLGIPLLSQDASTRLDLLRFADTELSACVDKGFHAIAADEQRVDFTPTLWDPDAERVVQCCFPGAHADVGGGYARGTESELSDIALDWMISQLETVGVQFATLSAAQPGFELGPMHSPWTSPTFARLPKSPREFPNYADPIKRILLHPALRQRLAQKVSVISGANSAVNQTVPYIPIALVNAGYLDVAAVAANP